MILDERTEFADDTALSTAGVGRARIGDEIDIGTDTMNHWPEIYFVIQVTQSLTSGGAATVSFEVVSDAQVPITTNGTETIHYATPAIPVAQLTAGRSFALRLPNGNYERFLGLNQNVATAALTAGRINAFLTDDVAQWRAFADTGNPWI